MVKHLAKNDHKNIHILNHPLLSHSLSILRRKETNCGDFRRLLSEVSRLMAYESSRDLKTKNQIIKLRLKELKAPLFYEDVTIVAVMRAGWV